MNKHCFILAAYKDGMVNMERFGLLHFIPEPIYLRGIPATDIKYDAHITMLEIGTLQSSMD